MKRQKRRQQSAMEWKNREDNDFSHNGISLFILFMWNVKPIRMRIIICGAYLATNSAQRMRQREKTTQQVTWSISEMFSWCWRKLITTVCIYMSRKVHLNKHLVCERVRERERERVHHQFGLKYLCVSLHAEFRIITIIIVMLEFAWMSMNEYQTLGC